MKNITLPFFLLILFNTILNSCTQSTSISTFANENESIVINELNCWSSYSAELAMKLIVFSSNQNEKDKQWKKWQNEIDEAKKNGQKLLLNDTIFISCIRNDSMYNSLLSQRKILFAKLLKHKTTLPRFKENIIKISNEVVEYKFYNYNGFGLCEKSLQDANIFSLDNEKFYINYSELLKEAFTESSSKISDQDLVSLNSLLKEIENIDRHIWCRPHYLKTLEEIRNNNLKDEKNKKFETLTK